jgi:TolA-binding protein
VIAAIDARPRPQCHRLIEAAQTAIVPPTRPTTPPVVAPVAPVAAPPPAQNVAAIPPPVAPPASEDHSSHSRHHHGSDSDANNAAPAPARVSSYTQARAAYEHHDYAQARTLANAAVREQPNSAEAHALLAELLGRANDSAGALNEWRAASRSAPRNTDYLHRIANIQLDRFDRAGATATLRQILQIAPNDSAAQRQLQSLGGGGAAPANNNARPANNNTARPANTTPSNTARPAPAVNNTRPTTTRRTGGSDPFVPTFGAPAPRSTGRAGSIRR